MERMLLTKCGGLLLLLSLVSTISGDGTATAPGVDGTLGPTQAATPAAADPYEDCDRSDLSPTCPPTPPSMAPSPSPSNDTDTSTDADTGTVAPLTDPPEQITTAADDPILPNTGLPPLLPEDNTTTAAPEEETQAPNTTVPGSESTDAYVSPSDNETMIITTEEPLTTTKVPELITNETDTYVTTVAAETTPDTNITEELLTTETLLANETDEQPAEPTTTTTIPIIEDPCETPSEGLGSYYSLPKPDGEVGCFVNMTTPSSWLRFYVDGENAEIPTVAIKQDYCAVHFSYHVFLRPTSGGLPEVNSTVEAEICTPMQGEVFDDCAHGKPIEIHNCGLYYVYRFPESLNKPELCNTKRGAGICLIKPGENITYDYIHTVPTTVPPPETTTVPEKELPTIERELTEEEGNGTVTIHYLLPKDVDENNITNYWLYNKDEQFRQFIAKVLNGCFRKAPQAKPIVVETTTKTQETTATTTLAEDKTTIETITKSTTIAVKETKETTVPGTTSPTTTTTTTTTHAPTEPPFILVTEIIEDGEGDGGVIGVPDTRPDGPELPDNSDDDSAKGPGRRRRADDTDECTGPFNQDNVFYVYETPDVVKGRIRVSFLVLQAVPEDDNKTDSTYSGRIRRAADGSGGVVSQDELFDALNDVDEETYQEEMDLEYEEHYKGKPREPTGHSSPVPVVKEQTSVWDTHMGLFIAVIVLVIICLIVVIIGILCIKCKGKKSRPEKTPLRAEEAHCPTVIENPISDEEMIRGEQAYMTEAPNPAYTPNGSGHHLTKSDEDNGWVVPLEELTYAERGRPEVDNTRL